MIINRQLAKQRSKRFHRFIRLSSWFIFIILLILFIYYLKAPSVGQITVTPPSEPLPDYATQQLAGQRFSFTYSGSLKTLEHNQETGDSYLEKVVLTASQPLSRRFAISVRRHNETSYTGVPDIQKRRSETNIYTEAPFSLAGRAGLLFTRTAGGFEETVFIPRDASTILTISLTSPELGHRGELAAEWQSVIDSFVLR